MAYYTNRPTPPSRGSYPSRNAPQPRRRGCSAPAALGILALVVLLGVIVWLAWPRARSRPQTYSPGAGSWSLSRPTVVTSATPTLVGASRMTPTASLVSPTATVAAGAPSVTVAPASPTPLPTGTPATAAPDWAALQNLMLNVINQDRAAARLMPVAWDQQAAEVGAAHAAEMVTAGYFSHWDMAGQGPDLRYALAGGIETVNENLHLYWLRYDDGSGAPIEDWEAVVLAGQKGLMESPGHRANILDPAHTQVGIGMAYDQATGTLAIAQEFINRYVALNDPPRLAERGARYVITGSVSSGVSAPVLNIRYLPHPKPLTVAQLESKPDVYQSESTFFDYGVATINGNALELSFTVPDDAPAGIYLVCLWVGVERLPGEEPQVVTLALPLTE